MYIYICIYIYIYMYIYIYVLYIYIYIYIYIYTHTYTPFQGLQQHRAAVFLRLRDFAMRVKQGVEKRYQEHLMHHQDKSAAGGTGPKNSDSKSLSGTSECHRGKLQHAVHPLRISSLTPCFNPPCNLYILLYYIILYYIILYHII